MTFTPDQDIADQPQRRRALDVATSFIVQAPAGSGKTELLTQRYLALLVTVNAPEEIIAITFTRKAAAEMRLRILAALDKAASEAAPMSAHERQTWELASAVLQHDKAHQWNLMINAGRLRIQTIDALSASLTRQMPLLSRFGTLPGTVKDASDLYREAARNTIAELESGADWSAAIEHLLRHRANNLEDVEALIITMLARRDQWLRHVADPRHPRIERSSLEAGLEYVVKSALQDLSNTVPDDLAAQIVKLANYAAGHLQSQGKDSPLLQCLNIATLPGRAVADVDAWIGLAYLLLTDKGQWRKKADVRIGFPAPGSAENPEEKNRFKEMKDSFNALLEKLSGRDTFRNQLYAVRALPPASYDDGQWQTLQALFELLRLAVAQLELVFQAHGKVDFTAISQAAVQALGGPDNPTDLALALDYRIRHVLIDEFQDTSLSQYQLLERLTAGWEAGDGRTLFAVGDPMQSIYRFREADVGLYLRARQEGIGQVYLEPLTLSVNFRSQQGIVDWVNRSFSSIFPAREDVAMGAVSYSESIACHPELDDKAVHVHPVIGRDDTAEAERVVSIVENYKKQTPDESIAILVRSRHHLLEIVEHLNTAGLSFQAIEIERLGHRPVVQDLLALTRALLHPADRIAWLSLLRAPWCGLTLADLHCLSGDDRQTILWDAINDEKRRSGLSEDGRQRVTRIIEVLQASMAQRHRQSLRRWVEGTWLALGGPACVPEVSDLDDADVFLDLLDELEEGGDIIELAALEQQLHELYALPSADADQHLQIMTIHKAKGLEFDHVIIPGLGRRTSSQEQRLLMWMERTRSHDTSDLLLAPIKATGHDPDPIYQYLYQLQHSKGLYEDGRVLYVAATRARKHLHLLGHCEYSDKDDQIKVRAPVASSLLARLWPVVEAEFSAAAQHYASANSHGDNEGKVVVADAALSVIRRLNTTWQLPAAPEAVNLPEQLLEEIEPAVPDEVIEFLWAGETARHVGTVIHKVLEQLADSGVEHFDRDNIQTSVSVFRASLVAQGVPDSELEHALERVNNALLMMLGDQRGCWILDKKHDDAHCEYPLTGVHNGKLVHITVDRTFIDEQGTRWIIDYKTGTHEGGGREAFLDSEQERYRAQLELYAALMSKKEQRPIRLGLYFPQIKGWREWGC